VALSQYQGATGGIEGLVGGLIVVVSTVVATSLFGSGVALIATTGPFAVFVAFLVAAAVMFIGADEAKIRLMDADLPPFVRSFRSEEKTLRKLRSEALVKEAELARTLGRQFNADAGPDVAGQIAALLGRELEQAAAAAEMLLA